MVMTFRQKGGRYIRNQLFFVLPNDDVEQWTKLFWEKRPTERGPI